MEKLHIVKIQRSCMHDGTGIRTTVFFKGCGLRCLWCQNPETWEFDKDGGVSAEALLEDILKDKKYYFSSGGGVTLSGGEPLLQDKDALLEFLTALKKENIRVAVETSLYAPTETLKAVIPFVDLFLADLKVYGNPDLHIKLTGKDDKLIKDNVSLLLSSDVKVKMRMAIVPSLNDNETDLISVAEFLKERGIHEIELMKYHNLYEEKADRLGIAITKLGITPEKSLEAVKKAISVFETSGIRAFSIETEPTPPVAQFSERVYKIRDDIRNSPRALCLEVSKLKTKYYKKNKGFSKPTPIHRSERLAYVLRNKTVNVYPNELLVGNFTAKRVAGQVWEEQYGILFATLLPTLKRQKPVPFECSFKDKVYFFVKILPYWFKHSILRKAHPKLRYFLKSFARTFEMRVGFNNNLASIAHYIVNFDRILTLGTKGLIEELRKTAKEKPQNNQNFYRGAITALEGLADFSKRYAELLSFIGKEEKDAARRKELEEMAKICEKVPENPAENFREALQSMLFLQVALCLESYENAVSFGRLDQILYPYYKADIEKGILTYDDAKELLALFVLKMDEAILVNDGDSIMNVSKLFETLSTDQSLTFGGVDKEGNDAVNDLTYIFIDICELQPLAVNMTARISPKNPDKYLRRLAEIYINGCPMPELFSDEIYIESIQRHYDTSLENARDYSIVGCVEPTASDDHYGNTDCANMNLALPLLQALKGHEHDLWNYGMRKQLSILCSGILSYVLKNKKGLGKAILAHREKAVLKRERKAGMFIYNPPKDMDELLERFQIRLNKLAGSILADHQNIEKVLRTDFTTPLASSLYRGCVASGKDVYEGGTTFNSCGIQAIGVTDVADSLYAIDEIAFNQKLYTLTDIIEAIEKNFQGERNQKIREALLSVPKFGDDSDRKPAVWVTKVMEIYNKALASVPNVPRNGYYSAGYYALNVNDRYGKNTGALPSGRLKGVPFANSVTPHYAMEKGDLLSSLNAISEVNFTDFAPNGTTVTFTIDSGMFQGEDGVSNLACIFRTFLTEGGMQFQPNILNRKILQDAYDNPENYKYLMVRIAGYCAYFNELSDELKKIIINRTCYA